MRKILILISTVLIPMILIGQSQNENYIKTSIYKKPYKESEISTSPSADKINSISYFDGLGRIKQSIIENYGGQGERQITHHEYDQYGREIKKYLPYAAAANTSDLDFNLNADQATLNFYQNKFPSDFTNGLNPFAEASLEASPLNRVLKQGAPGSDWKIIHGSDADHTEKFDYDINSGIDVKKFNVFYDANGNRFLSIDGNYEMGELTKKTIKDENWKTNSENLHTSQEFVDKEGRVVLKRNFSFGVPKEKRLDTNYIYDDFGNLAYVLSPEASDRLEQLAVYEDIVNYTISWEAFVGTNIDLNGNSTPVVNGSGNVVINLDGATKTLTVSYNLHYDEPVSLLPVNIPFSNPVPSTILGTLNTTPNIISVLYSDGNLISRGDYGAAITDYVNSFTVVLDDHYYVSQEVIDNLGYQYIYDERGRVIKNKLPGKGWQSIVYDRLDRPVLTQDPNLETQNQWLFTKYDAYDREVYTGLFSSNQTRAELQATVNAITTGFNEARIATPINYTDVEVYYSNAVFPNTNIEVLTVNYYDDYNFGNPEVLLASDDVTLSTYLSQVDNVITKSTNSVAWNAGFTTDSKITGDGYIEFTALEANKRQMIGLSTDSNIDTTFHYGTIDFAIDIGHNLDNYVRIWENGTGISSGITFVPSDVFRIERIGTVIYYKKNGVTFYQSTETSTGDLTGDSSFLDFEARVSDVKIIHTINGQVITGNTQGLDTGSVVRILDTNQFIHTITQYDEKARATYMASKNEYLNTHDVVTNTYDFVGNVLETNTSHTKSGVAFGTVGAVLTKDTFTYDHQNRLLTHTQTIDNRAPEVLVANHYDELGQLTQKKTGVTTHDISSSITNIYRVAQEGQTISKVVSDGWDGNFETVKTIASDRDGYIEFTITETGKYNMIGLSNPNGTLDNGYTTIDYAIYTGSGTFGNDVRIYENGTIQQMPYTMFAPGDTFKIERLIDQTTNTGEVKYYKNGIEIYTSGNASNTALIGDASLGKQGSYVKDVRFVITNPDDGQSLQTVDYAYNVRGWLKQINDPSQSLTNDLFAFKINYNTPETTLGATALYNGNISETLWRTASDDELHAYGYTYDALNRIASANYAQGTAHNVNAGFYNLNSISYDKNGNILALQRNAADATHTSAISIDNLVYGYQTNSNKLTRVTDSAVNTEGFNDNYINNSNDPADNDYLYDPNGNLIVDKDKYITSIEYNHLNLPTKVTFSNQTGGLAPNTIEYVYDATGVKQQKLVTINYGLNVQKHGTQYAGNYVYSGADTNGQGYFYYGLEFFSHGEGYIEPYLNNGTSLFRYVYQHKDHLGNIRVAYTDYDNDGKIDIYRNGIDIDGDLQNDNDIVQAKNYYPFGLQIKHGVNNALSIVNGRNHKYGFGGKEYQDELNLAWYDITARNYDVALGRWMNIDPLAEEMRKHSPYNYAFDNPVYFIDPDGMAPQSSSAMGYIQNFGFELMEDAESLASSNGTNYEAIERLNEKSRNLTMMAATMDVLVATTRFVLESMPYGEELAVVAEIAVTGKPEEAFNKYLSTRIENAPYEATALLIPGVSGKNLKTASKIAKRGSKADFVVTSSGTAVSTDLGKISKSFDNAGFKKLSSNKYNSIYEVPRSNGNGTFYSRLQKGNPKGKSGYNGDRVINTLNNGDIDNKQYVLPNGNNFPNGTPLNDRRAGGHIHLKPKY